MDKKENVPNEQKLVEDNGEAEAIELVVFQVSDCYVCLVKFIYKIHDPCVFLNFVCDSVDGFFGNSNGKLAIHLWDWFISFHVCSS